MFSLTRRYPLFRKLVIAVFSIPLMFLGGAFVGNVAQERSIGAVGDLKVPREEFFYRYQSALEEYRRLSGTVGDDIPAPIAEAITNRVRGEIVSYYLMKSAMKQKGLRAPDVAVAEEIRRTPDFQDESGEFSPALYRQFVSDRRGYQERVREGIERESLLRAMGMLPPRHIYEQLATFRRQQRVVDEAVLPLSDLPQLAAIAEEEIAAYYENNAEDYRQQEEADFEYFIFSLDKFAATLEVSEDDILAAYEDFRAVRAGFERRRASHIYLTDQALAEEVAQQALADPSAFAQLAAQHSEDAFSAQNGGELGIFADGDLPLELNDVLFAMQPGAVHAPVETEQGGYSILKLDEVIHELVPPLAAVRDEMVQRARRVVAQEDFDAKVEALRELAPLELGSLHALAQEVGEPLSQGLAIRRTVEDNQPPFDDAVVLADAFDELVVQRSENSPPIPLGAHDVLFVRALRYQQAGLQPLEEARPQISGILRAQQLSRAMRLKIAQSRHGEAEEAEGGAADGTTPAWFDEAASADGVAAALADFDVEALLRQAQWAETHTVALAAAEDEVAGLNTADGAADDTAAAAALPTAAQDGLDERSVDSVFAADLSYGLPAYVFVPQEKAVRVLRLREIIDNPPQAQDYLVVEELLGDLSAQIASAGYLDMLNSQYEYEFYNTPEVVQQSAPQ